MSLDSLTEKQEKACIDICERIAAGESLNEIDRSGDPGILRKDQFLKLAMAPENHELRDLYRFARQVQAEVYADEIISISDEPADRKEKVLRNTLRVNTRKWIISKMLPKIYGDRVQLSGEEGGPLKILVEYVNPDTEAA